MMEQPPPAVRVEFNPKILKMVVKWGMIILLLIGLLVIIPALRKVITIVIIALFLAFLFDPLVNFIENRGIDRLLAVVCVFALIAVIVVLAAEFLAPILTKEFHELSSGVENQSPEELINQLQQKLGKKIPILTNPTVQQELKTLIAGFLKKSFSIVINLLSTLISVVMLTFITFFFLKDGRRMKKVVVSWVPNRYFEMALIILHKTSTKFGRYIRGQLLVAAIVGMLSIMALYYLHVRYFIFIGAMAGIANMIPYFGPIVGAIPAIIIALIDTGSFGAVAIVAVAFASIQLFENIFVSPFIVSKSVELHPLTIIIAILIGGQLLGIFGMLLAVPTASVIKVTAQELIWGFKNYHIFE